MITNCSFSPVLHHFKKFWWLYLIALVLFLFLVPLFINITSEKIGQYGDFIGGIVGTLISLITLIVIYESFKQVNEQSLQSTIALLLQSYQHTVEDFDFKNKHGREAIKESLTLYKEGTEKNYISEFFPTHIPAIIVSILYTISDSDNNNKKDKLYTQVKTMLSFEERQLLLLYLLELKGSDDEKDQNEDFEKDKKLLKESIFINVEKSKAVCAFDTAYTKIYH